MADKTIEWLHGVRAQDAHKPFFVYFSTGCSHAPHHVAPAWADKYKGQFDQGWDRLREEVFARQKELGVIPADAELTPRDEAFPAWDDVPDKLKAYYARQMEVYAGFSENADYNVGRVIDAIDELGELDNTVIIWIWGDNGASMEGTITGSFNEMTMQNGIPLSDEMQLQLAERYGGIEAWGGPMMDPHYSAACSYAISADLVIPAEGAEGVIVAEADHLGGFSLWVEDGKLTHTYSMMGVFIYRQQADEPLPAGEVTVRPHLSAQDEEALHAVAQHGHAGHGLSA